MCGIVGSVTEPGSAIYLQGGIREGVHALRHRGPNAQGVATVRLPWADVVLGMARLSIVDYEADLTVPHRFESCGVVVAYNGEVYNWRDLRAELSNGIPWETDCDVEVVARAWRRWGPACLDRFNGMFAFALADIETGVVFLARDRAGEKPLYYAPHPAGGVCFASEAKALPIQIREASCPELEALEYDCAARTPFAGVRSLGPGQCLLLGDLDTCQAPTPATWWTLPTDVDEGMPWHDAVDALEELLVDAIRLRAQTERPVAVLLSGGLDSAIVQAVVRERSLYCVDFPGEIDNLSRAALATAGVADPVPVTFGYEDLVEVLPRVAYHLDTPATWTAVCLWHLAQRIAADRSGVVVVSGEGADELFLGYTRYRLLHWLARADADPLLEAYRPTRRHLFGTNAELLARLIDRSGGQHRHVVDDLVERHATGRDLLADAGRVDFYTQMQVLLRMPDRMMAAFSLENRSPFLDVRVMEFAGRCPTRHKVTDRESKAVLREVARRLGVHPDIVGERTKRGLAIPWPTWRPTMPEGGRGGWDRSDFARMMREAWRAAFFGPASRRRQEATG